MLRKQWKQIKGYPNYRVSNYGEIETIRRLVVYKDGRTRWRGGIRISPTTPNGYHYVGLNRNGVRKYFYVHILVLKHFGPPKPSPLHESNHKDGDKSWNWIGNLEWLTHQENIQHSYDIGLRS